MLVFYAFDVQGDGFTVAPSGAAPTSLRAVDSTNPDVSVNIKGLVVRLVDIAGGQDITTAAGLQAALAADGEYANIDMTASATSRAVIITSATDGADPDQVFFASSTATGVITVSLVGQITNNVAIGDYVAGNFLV